MRSTYINGSRKFLIAAITVACLAVCLILATGAGARTTASHAGVPTGVRLIYTTVLMPSGASTTTVNTLKARNHLINDAVQVKSVDQQVDAMSNVPSRAFACPMFVLANQPKITMTFRASADGPALAEIQVNVAIGQRHESGSGACSPIHFWIRNKAQKALLSKSFVQSVGHMIGSNIS